MSAHCARQELQIIYFALEMYLYHLHKMSDFRNKAPVSPLLPFWPKNQQCKAFNGKCFHYFFVQKVISNILH